MQLIWFAQAIMHTPGSVRVINSFQVHTALHFTTIPVPSLLDRSWNAYNGLHTSRNCSFEVRTYLPTQKGESWRRTKWKCSVNCHLRCSSMCPRYKFKFPVQTPIPGNFLSVFNLHSSPFFQPNTEQHTAQEMVFFGDCRSYHLNIDRKWNT